MAFAGPLISAASGYLSYKQGKKQQAAQAEALTAQQAAEAKVRDDTLMQQKKSQRAITDAQRKAPDVQNLLSRNKESGGISSTMLTGAQGIDPNSLSLGKKTLLGG